MLFPGILINLSGFLKCEHATLIINSYDMHRNCNDNSTTSADMNYCLSMTIKMKSNFSQMMFIS